MSIERSWRVLCELGLILVGCMIYAVSVLMTNQINMIPGSLLGVAVIANKLLLLPIGLVNLLLNIPLMVVSTKFLGRKLLIYTILTLSGTSFLIDLGSDSAAKFPAWHAVVITVLGGVLMGVGAGILLRAGATMGGTTAIARLFLLKYPELRMGNALMLMDGAIILIGALLLQDSMALFYSVLYTVLCMKTIDLILYDPHRLFAWVGGKNKK